MNPTLVKPRRLRATVLFSDIVGFSYFAERLKPEDLIDVVNSHIDACTEAIDRHGGQKPTSCWGTVLLPIFPSEKRTWRSAAATDILEEMSRRRKRASGASPHHLLYGGIGLSNGMVYEGSIGDALKRDFTIFSATQ